MAVTSSSGALSVNNDITSCLRHLLLNQALESYYAKDGCKSQSARDAAKRYL